MIVSPANVKVLMIDLISCNQTVRAQNVLRIYIIIMKSPCTQHESNVVYMHAVIQRNEILIYHDDALN